MPTAVPQASPEGSGLVFEHAGAQIVIEDDYAFVALPPNGIHYDEDWEVITAEVAAYGYVIDYHLESGAELDDGYGDRFVIFRKESYAN